LCVEWTPANLERLAGALRELDAELAVSADDSVPVPVLDARLLSDMEIANWSTRAGRLDMLRSIPTATRSRASSRSSPPAPPNSPWPSTGCRNGL
jgi:hypothetical protein